MDVFELLKSDHRKVSKLFDQIESASGQAKKRAFTQLKTELDLHAELEERLFYPRLEKAQPSRDITLEAYEEHKVVKDLLAELASNGVSDEWDAKLKVLRENVEHHVEEEEGELFDKAEDVLSDEELEKIGAQMEGEKARVLGSGDPSRNGGSGNKKAQASRGGTKKKQSQGVLSRLANFVGLSDSSSEGARKSAGKEKSSAGASKAGKKAGKKAASKGTSKSASKGAAKSSKSSGARKSAGKGAASGRGAKKKATKSTSSKGGATKRARSK